MMSAGNTYTEEVSRPHPRTFFRSKWYSETVTYTKSGKVVTENSHHDTYVKPKVDGEIKGKLNLKAAKRAKVRAWKERDVVAG